jgi:hypothetical protein
MDDEQGTVQVSFNDDVWYGRLDEVVFVDTKAEEFSAVWLGMLYNASPTNKSLRWLNFLTEQQLAPPIIEGKFKLGEKVKAMYSRRMVPGEIRAVLVGNAYAVGFENGSFSEKVAEEDIESNPFQRGMKVRIRRLSDDQYWNRLQNGVEPGMIGEIVDVASHNYNSRTLRVRLKIRSGMKTVMQWMLDSEIDFQGDARWFTQAKATDGAQQNVQRLPLPKSASTIVDRAFSDGVTSVDVFVRDGHYTANFQTMEILDTKTGECIGSLIRDPPSRG